MSDEEIKATYPEYTVIVYEENGEIKRANTSDYYAEYGKTYDDALERLKKNNGWRIIQSRELYQVTKILEKEQKKEKCASDYFERIQDISNELDNLVNDMGDDL